MRLSLLKMAPLASIASSLRASAVANRTAYVGGANAAARPMSYFKTYRCVRGCTPPTNAATSVDGQEYWRAKILERLPLRWCEDSAVMQHYENLQPWSPPTSYHGCGCTSPPREEDDETPDADGICRDQSAIEKERKRVGDLQKKVMDYCEWYRCQRRHYSSQNKPPRPPIVPDQPKKAKGKKDGGADLKPVKSTEKKGTVDKVSCFLGPFCNMFKGLAGKGGDKAKAESSKQETPASAKKAGDPKNVVVAKQAKSSKPEMKAESSSKGGAKGGSKSTCDKSSSKSTKSEVICRKQPEKTSSSSCKKSGSSSGVICPTKQEDLKKDKEKKEKSSCGQKSSKSSCNVPKKDDCEKPKKDVCQKPKKDESAKPKKSSCQIPKKDDCEKPKKDVCKKPKKDDCEKPKKDACKKPKKDECAKPKKDDCAKPKQSSCKIPKKDDCDKPKKDVCKKPKKDDCAKPKKSSDCAKPKSSCKPAEKKSICSSKAESTKKDECKKEKKEKPKAKGCPIPKHKDQCAKPKKAKGCAIPKRKPGCKKTKKKSSCKQADICGPKAKPKRKSQGSCDANKHVTKPKKMNRKGSCPSDTSCAKKSKKSCGTSKKSKKNACGLTLNGTCVKGGDEAVKKLCDDDNKIFDAKACKTDKKKKKKPAKNQVFDMDCCKDKKKQKKKEKDCSSRGSDGSASCGSGSNGSSGCGVKCAGAALGGAYATMANAIYRRHMSDACSRDRDNDEDGDGVKEQTSRQKLEAAAKLDVIELNNLEDIFNTDEDYMEMVTDYHDDEYTNNTYFSFTRHTYYDMHQHLRQFRGNPHVPLAPPAPKKEEEPKQDGGKKTKNSEDDNDPDDD